MESMNKAGSSPDRPIYTYLTTCLEADDAIAGSKNMRTFLRVLIRMTKLLSRKAVPIYTFIAGNFSLS